MPTGLSTEVFGANLRWAALLLAVEFAADDASLRVSSALGCAGWRGGVRMAVGSRHAGEHEWRATWGHSLELGTCLLGPAVAPG